MTAKPVATETVAESKTESAKAESAKRNVAGMIDEKVYDRFEDFRWQNRLNKAQALEKLLNMGIDAAEANSK